MTRRLDALVAEHIDGWEWVTIYGVGSSRTELYKHGKDAGYFPHYSENIAAAWYIVEKLKADTMPTFGMAWHNGEWVVSWETDDPNNVFGFMEAQADTAPLAICIAALLAVGVDEATINEAQGE